MSSQKELVNYKRFTFHKAFVVTVSLIAPLLFKEIPSTKVLVSESKTAVEHSCNSFSDPLPTNEVFSVVTDTGTIVFSGFGITVRAPEGKAIAICSPQRTKVSRESKGALRTMARLITGWIVSHFEKTLNILNSSKRFAKDIPQLLCESTSQCRLETETKGSCQNV